MDVGTGISEKKAFTDDPVLKYCLKHSTPIDPVVERLIKKTWEGAGAPMLGAIDQHKLFEIVIRGMGAKKAIEVGVFTGLGTLMMARALSDGGKVIGCEVTTKFMDAAGTREAWREAGVEHKIDLRLGPATETLQSLIDAGEAGTFDFAFIDADKPPYEEYYELCLKLVRTGGIITIDNVLWHGQVLNKEATEKSTQVLQRIGKKAASDGRVKAIMTNQADGVLWLLKL